MLFFNIFSLATTKIDKTLKLLIIENRNKILYKYKKIRFSEIFYRITAKIILLVVCKEVKFLYFWITCTLCKVNPK